MAIQQFNLMANRAAVAAGFKGGNFFTKPAPLPALSVSEVPVEVTQKFEALPVQASTPIDPWVYRKGGMK